jgi:hypothetical protein
LAEKLPPSQILQGLFTVFLTKTCHRNRAGWLELGIESSSSICSLKIHKHWNLMNLSLGIASPTTPIPDGLTITPTARVVPINTPAYACRGHLLHHKFVNVFCVQNDLPEMCPAW